MKACKIDMKQGVIRYHYKYSDLKQFLTFGKQNGSNGFILTRIKGDYLTYRGFGTIESPCRELRTIHVSHDYNMDGDIVLFSSEENLPFTSIGLQILDFSDEV